jgi:hypothetical protein
VDAVTPMSLSAQAAIGVVDGLGVALVVGLADAELVGELVCVGVAVGVVVGVELGPAVGGVAVAVPPVARPQTQRTARSRATTTRMESRRRTQ